MPYLYPTVQQFKDQFYRDFPYGTDLNTSITDQDIVAAFNLAHVNWNSDFWCDQNSFTTGFNLLSAHYLVMNIRQSSQGTSGQFNFTQSGKSAGSVSESFAIPDRITENPEFAWLTKTNYGAQYLMLILPQLSGQVFTVLGDTLP